jgi:hypothetical protein
MAEYIERETAVRAVMAAKWMDGSDGAMAMEIVASQAAADVAPVVHGRWEMRPTGMATDTGPEYKAYCTVCNKPNKQYQPPFCPHCGAKMDGGADHAAD